LPRFCCRTSTTRTRTSATGRSKDCPILRSTRRSSRCSTFFTTTRCR
jgi:hypothetical protein